MTTGRGSAVRRIKKTIVGVLDIPGGGPLVWTTKGLGDSATRYPCSPMHHKPAYDAVKCGCPYNRKLLGFKICFIDLKSEQNSKYDIITFRYFYIL